MNAEAIYAGEISKLKRRVFSRFVYRTLLWSCILFLGSLTVLFLIAGVEFFGHSRQGLWILLLSAISMIAAFVVTRSGRRAFQAFLIDLDARLQLGDCISTAFEYQQSGNESVFSDLLMQEATAKLRRLSTREIFPAEFSRLYFFLILMVITAGALFFNHYSISDFTPVSVDQNKIEKAKILVQDFIKSHLAVNRSKEAKENPVITRSIEQLRKTLNEPEINQERLFASLNRHLKEVQAEQARQAAELDARLDDANILNMPIQDSPDLQSLKAGQLEKLKKLLNQALNNQIPDGIHDNMESLQELFSLEKLLSQVIDEFHEGDSDQQGLADSGRYQPPNSSYPEDSTKKENDSFQPKAAGQSSADAQNGETDFPGRSRSGLSSPDNFDVSGEGGLSPGSSPQAGSAKSNGSQKPGSEIEKASGSGVQDKVMSAQVKQYLVRIRTQTATGESKLKEEEIVRTYRKEIEGVLQKEEIPLNYRDYIKHYFLSIGLETEDSLK